MKHPFVMAVLTFCAFSQYAFGQTLSENPAKYTTSNKGKFFISWGGNRDRFTKSDIRFKGKDYDFTLYDVKSNDKPKGWHCDYLNPLRMTIPQTNFKIGYFISDHYSVAIGVDHMKYVMFNGQTVNMSGTISGHPSYNGVYDNTPTVLTEEFLTFEHTDGLNFVHLELSRFDDISHSFHINNTDIIQINLTEGLAAGILYPKTNTQLMGKERHDDFHISGYGVSLKAGLNITFLKYFFLQGELKGGYVNMPDIRTTNSSSDSASQHFFFYQQVVSLGGIFRF